MADEEDRLRARIKDLEAALHQNNDTIAIVFELTPVLNKLFGLLYSLPKVTAQHITQRLDISADSKVTVHRLRTHLKNPKWNMAVRSKRGLGYWFDDETKARIREMLAAKAAPPVTTNTTVLEAA